MEKTVVKIITRVHHTPYGNMQLGSYKDKLCLCDWMDSPRFDENRKRIRKALKAEYETGDSEVITKAMHQLDEYFAGKRFRFDIPYLFTGTDFQHKVWAELTEIGYGKTTSYAQMAERIGQPKAIRAVANANARNPLPIIVPCHRVIGASGELSGYSAGKEVKRILLEKEGVDLSRIDRKRQRGRHSIRENLSIFA